MRTPAFASGLLRRGMEVANAPDAPKPFKDLQLSPWGVFVCASTVFVFVLLAASVSGRCSCVLPGSSEP